MIFQKGNKLSWKGGRTTQGNGYIVVFCPSHPNAYSSGYVLEHRLVMEKHIGRTLLTHERVHHINGDTKDNKLENLMLFATESEHKKQHKKETKKKCQ